MFNLPNLLTIFNLLSGCMAVVSVFRGDFEHVLLFFGACLLFDLLDGLAARALGITSELGAELDSLADMISFGLLPGVVLFSLIQGHMELDKASFFPAILGFVYTAAAALRLAKFNLDERQSTDFLGLNTPAASIAILGLYVNAHFGHCAQLLGSEPSNLLLFAFTLILSVLLLVDIPMLSFKFTPQDKARTASQVLLILGGIIILAILKTCALAFLILWYILFSIIRFTISKTKK